ncbi:protein POLLEN DEFECTIVE IN GUIDANCE 1 [Cornus florida]|uniref:protein POLLEN DEFECTIVE IN GUIDANCE 1 n=1 Tax=Cornus florida TaxID=4283 RepID=UPI002898D334|nr:protein POLLEN DEFECTIVE IN GUIDANCE 1 [Cornus florida]
MALRSSGRKLSFEVLGANSFTEDDDTFIYRSNSDPPLGQNGETSRASPSELKSNRRKRKAKKKKSKIIRQWSISEDSVVDDLRHTLLENGSSINELELNCNNYSIQSVICEEVTVPEESVGTVCATPPVAKPEFQNVHGSDGYLVGELRQRTVVNGSGGCEEAVSRTGENAKEKEKEKEESRSKELDSSLGRQRVEPSGNAARKLETAESLDWNRVMAEDPNYQFSVEKSPVKYFMEEMYGGNSLRSTTTLGNEKERERVYDTIFRLPWRCELLINVGYFVCLDSFLSLLTIMPARLLLTFWRLLKTRQFKKPSAAELSDFGCFIVLVCGVALLEQTDISLIYHMIRGQGTIKLYVVYNVLEIFDKLCQSFGGDVLQTLFNSAEGLGNCSPETTRYWIWRFISDEALAVASSIVHSFILLAQAITLSTCIVAHNNALLAMLVSNNFSEIKSSVFKRFSKDNIHSLVYYDSIERFHISAFILFVLAQNILEAEGPWFESFLFNALLVYICEMMIDIIKHSFIAKFNDIKPIAYSEFLEELCKQTLKIQTENGKNNLTFVPLAPACVVIRVLSPVYTAHLPYCPLLWRFFWIFLLSTLTFIMLASVKIMIGLGLQKHATWYVNRCRKRKLHTD